MNIFRGEDSSVDRGPLAPNFRPEVIDHIQIQTRYGVLNLRSHDGIWRVEERENYPASSLRIAHLLSLIGDVQVIDSVASDQKSLKEFSLLDPSEQPSDDSGNWLRLYGNEGYRLELLLGKTLRSGSEDAMHFGADFDGHRFAMHADGNRILTIDNTMKDVMTLMNFWIDGRSFREPRAQRVEYFEDGQSQWSLIRDDPDASFSCDYRGDSTLLPRLTKLVNGVTFSLRIDEMLPRPSADAFERDYTRYFQITNFQGNSYRLFVGPLVPIPREEDLYLSQTSGLFIPQSFTHRRSVLFKTAASGSDPDALQTELGTPYFDQPYLVNLPHLNDLLLNADELILFESILKNQG
ncbi:DUF4340 domain-containing protein [Coraliomargarita akajimensis]|nr:DUF4340 domain-containing protein [Coraliomargarita akajimensis]